MTKKRKRNRQAGSLKMNQYHASDLKFVQVQVHRGRVTVPFVGPVTNDTDMALDLFRQEIKDAKM